jgi:mono/diheme cytochrome c family protein
MQSATAALLAATVGAAAFLSGCHARGHATPDVGGRGGRIYTPSCSNCHTLTGHDTHAPGGDLLETDLGVADLESFARTMPIRPPLSAADAYAVAEYIHDAMQRGNRH